MNTTCYYALHGNDCPDIDELHSEGQASKRYSSLMNKFQTTCGNSNHVNCSIYEKLNKKVEEVEIK